MIQYNLKYIRKSLNKMYRIIFVQINQKSMIVFYSHQVRVSRILINDIFKLLIDQNESYNE